MCVQPIATSPILRNLSGLLYSYYHYAHHHLPNNVPHCTYKQVFNISFVHTMTLQYNTTSMYPCKISLGIRPIQNIYVFWDITNQQQNMDIIMTPNICLFAQPPAPHTCLSLLHIKDFSTSTPSSKEKEKVHTLGWNLRCNHYHDHCWKKKKKNNFATVF